MGSEAYRCSERLTLAEAAKERINLFVRTNGFKPDAIELGRLEFEELSSSLRRQNIGAYINENDMKSAKIDGIQISVVDKPTWFKFRKLKATNSRVSLRELAKSSKS